MIDWQKVAHDLEKENARLKKDLEQFQMALAEQVELNKTLAKIVLVDKVMKDV